MDYNNIVQINSSYKSIEYSPREKRNLYATANNGEMIFKSSYCERDLSDMDLPRCRVWCACQQERDLKRREGKQ